MNNLFLMTLILILLFCSKYIYKAGFREGFGGYINYKSAPWSQRIGNHSALNSFISTIRRSSSRAPYCNKNINSLWGFNNRNVCRGTNRNIGFLITVKLYEPTGAHYDLEAGVDFGLGGGILIDNRIVSFTAQDQWGGGQPQNSKLKFFNKYISPGMHTITIAGGEGCCDGKSHIRFRRKAGLGGYNPRTHGDWNPLDITRLKAVAALAPPNSQGYKCVGGLTTPMKIIGGEVACLSKNKKDCEWRKGYCKGNKVTKSIWSGADRTALLCGPNHTRFWRGPGYENAGHWCNKAKQPLGFNERNSPYYRGLASKRAGDARRRAELARAQAEAARLAALRAKQKAEAERKAAELARLRALAAQKAAEEARRLKLRNIAELLRKAEEERKKNEEASKKLAAAERERSRIEAENIMAKIKYEDAKREEQERMNKQVNELRKQVAYGDKFSNTKGYHDNIHGFEEIEKQIQYKLEKRAAEIWTYADGPEGSLNKQLQFFKNGKYKGGDVPKGAIFMWTKIEIPVGWALCNGENGTPDLRDKFIFGADEEDLPGKTGGSDKITLDMLPKHSHEDLGGWDKFSVGTVGGMSDGAGKWQKRFVRSSSPAKTTFTKTKEIGGNKEYFPPYNRLAFIMKL
jgi:hypothetical protein